MTLNLSIRDQEDIGFYEEYKHNKLLFLMSHEHFNVHNNKKIILIANIHWKTYLEIWHFSHIMEKSQIGENCNIGQNVVVSPPCVILGNNVKVQNNVSIYSGVICEDDVFLGPSMVFTNILNPRSP